MSTVTHTANSVVQISDVPQVGWKNVEIVLQSLVGKKMTEAEVQFTLGGVTKRECAYVVQGLRFLGWTAGSRRAKHWPLALNADGVVAATNATKRIEDAWDLISNWSPAHLLINGKEQQALDELMCEGLNEITARRRLSTIKNWIKALNPDKAAVVSTAKNQRQLVDANQRYIDGVVAIADAIPNMAQQLCQGRVDIEDLPEGLDAKVLSKVRKFHHRFSKAVRKAYSNNCAMSGTKLMTYASHIKPWAVSTGVEKTDPENGLLLDERWDRLFDKGFVSFDDSGKVILSPVVKTAEWTARQIIGTETLKVPMSDKTKEYMKYHREHVLQK